MGEMPHTSEMNLIDYYIGFAYLMQFLLVLSTGITSNLLSHDAEYAVMLDWTVAAVLGVIWLIISFFYMSLACAPLRKCYNKCTSSGNLHFDDWEKRARDE